MSGITNPDYVQLASACSAQADQLQQIQKDENYQGPNIPSLYASEMSLRTKVLLLNTAAVGAALAADQNARNQLKAAITRANNAAQTIRDVQKAIQIAADLITLAAGVISDNPGSVIGAAAKLIGDANATGGGRGNASRTGRLLTRGSWPKSWQ